MRSIFSKFFAHIYNYLIFLIFIKFASHFLLDLFRNSLFIFTFVPFLIILNSNVHEMSV